MTRIPRRSLLKSALAGAASAQGEKPIIQGTAVTSFVSHFVRSKERLDEK